MSMIRSVFGLLNVSQKKSAIKVLILIIVGAVLDIFGLALVLPVLAISSSPEDISTITELQKLYVFFGFRSTDQFLLIMYLSLLLIFIVRALTFLYVKYVISKFSYGLSRTFSKQLFNVYLYKPLGFFQSNSTADLLRDVYVSTQQFSTYLIIPILQNISELLILFFVLGGLVLYNVQVFMLLVIVLGPISMMFYWLTKSKMEVIGKEVYSVNGQIINKVSQGIAGYIDVKLSSREQYFVKRFDDDQKYLSKLNITKSVLMDVFPKMIEFSAIMGIVVIFVYSLLFLKEDQKGMILLLGLFGASAYRILPSISRIMSGMLLIKQYGYLVDIIKIAIEPTNKKIEPTSDLSALELKHSVSLRNAKFLYSNESVFNIDIPSFKIAKGEKLGIIGKSGSGKTTLVNILLGFYELNSGEIYVDENRLSIKSWPLWKKNFGYVQQNVYVSDVSLKENIAFGVDENDIDDKRVLECVSLALLDDFVDTLNGGINGILKENGMNMSGGQRQRLAIARALYFDRRLLIFDEATSALDNETEKEVTDSIKSLSNGNITMIIIAHRFSTLKYCDRIIEMEDGKIKCEVEYDDLIQRN